VSAKNTGVALSEGEPHVAARHHDAVMVTKTSMMVCVGVHEFTSGKHANVCKPANLTGQKILRGFTIEESDIICVREHLVAHEIVLSRFEGMHQGKHLAFMCVVVALRAGLVATGWRLARPRWRQGGE